MPGIIRNFLSNLFGLAVSDNIGITVEAPPVVENITIIPSKTTVQATTSMYFEGQITVDGKGVERVVTLYINGTVLDTIMSDDRGSWYIPWTPSVPGTYSFYAEG